MKSISRARVWMIVTIMIAIGLCAPLGAQEKQGEASVAENKLLDESQELFQEIAEKIQEFDRVQAEIAAAEGEDKEALQKIAAELVIDYVKDVHELSANVIAREDDGQDIGDDREKVTEMFEQISGFFRKTIDGMKEKLTELRKGRSEVPPEELSQIEDRLVTLNQRLEDALGILLKEIEKREAFGLESTTERKYLSEVLTDRAKLLTGRIELARENEMNLGKRVEANPENAELRTELDLTHQRLDLYVGRLTTTVQQMDSLGLDTAEYQQLLFEVTGEITTGLLSREVMAGIVASWWDGAVDWLKNNGPRIFFKTLLFLVILLIFRVLSRFARKIVRKAIRTSSLKVSQLLERTALSVTGAVVMIFGLLVALSQLGVEVGPLLAGLGIAGFIVGFALQDTLANFAAGVMILMYRPFDVGDLIEAEASFGKVNDMSTGRDDDPDAGQPDAGRFPTARSGAT